MYNNKSFGPMYSIPLLSFLGYFFPFINDQKPLSKTLDNLRC